MGFAPSLSILAKNVIGQGIVQAQDRDHDKLDVAIRVGLYNFAMSELYNILSFIDTDAYQDEVSSFVATSGKVTKHGIITLAVSLDKIIDMFFTAGINRYEGFELNRQNFTSHLINNGAKSPYNEAVVYTHKNKYIEYVLGEDVDQIATAVAPTLYYRRSLTPLTVANYETEKFDAPDRYYSLIVNRIASLIESQKGITDKALYLVKTAYEQLLSSVEPIIKAGIMKSLDLPAGEAYDLQGYTDKGS